MRIRLYRNVRIPPFPPKPKRHVSTTSPPTQPSLPHLATLLRHSPSPLDLRHLHAHLLVTGHASDLILASHLLLSYSRHSLLLSSAVPFFHQMPHRNSHSWSILLSHLARAGYARSALDLFVSMTRAGFPPDAFSLPVLLRSCSSAGALFAGLSAHGLGVKVGLDLNPFVASALVFMYVGFGSRICAREVFDGIGERDVVLWTAMLSGYAQGGEVEMAVGVFNGMVREGIVLDGVVMVSLLLVCSRAGWLWCGKCVHGWCLRRDLGLGLSLGNAILDMYAKCGELEYAGAVFGWIPRKDVISWSALILGHGLDGNADVAVRLFKEMQAEGVVRPNLVTFLGVLSACAHAGLVEEAWEYWHMMKECKLVAELKHYACMVDVLARAGELVEAEGFIQQMPMEPDEAIWGALLSGCRVHGDAEVAKRASESLMKMKPQKSGYYAILANHYSDEGRYEDAERVRKTMKEMNVEKLPGYSLI